MSENTNVNLRLIYDELKGARSKIDDLVRDVATLKAQEQNLQRFWAENWGPLKSDIQDIKNRLSSLETKDVAAIERRVDTTERDVAILKSIPYKEVEDRLRSLEDFRTKAYGFAAASGAFGGVITVLLKLLFDALQ